MKLQYILLISFIILVVSFFNRNELPKVMDIHHEMAQEPTQQIIHRPEFAVNVDGTDYFIQPKYDYELYGLVVSYRLHDGDTGAHLRWGDHLNVADYCVVWSENAFKARLSEIEFRNREWACYYNASNQVLSDFNHSKLSNNHLITADSDIRNRIKKINIGDQIRIKGWLSSYRTTERFIRGTSINRNDRGNGACETIYVNDIEILNSHTSRWKYLMYLSLTVFLVTLIRYFYSPFKLND